MTGGVATFVRCFASVSDDTPLADRCDALGEAIEDYAASHRADMADRETERQAIAARFGLAGLIGPHNSTMEKSA